RRFLAFPAAPHVQGRLVPPVEGGRGGRDRRPGPAQDERPVFHPRLPFDFPAEGGLAVKQQQPTVGDLLRCQGVGLCLVARAGGGGGDQQEGGTEKGSHGERFSLAMGAMAGGLPGGRGVQLCAFEVTRTVAVRPAFLGRRRELGRQGGGGERETASPV